MKKIEQVNNIGDFKIVVNELYNSYKEWLEVFPFELEMFRHLKQEFTKELPIVKEAFWTLNDKVNEIVIDIYSNKTFQQFLYQKTTKLLSEINTLALLEDGKINDIEKHKLDLIIKERRIKLQSQVKWSRVNRPDYIDYISEWLNDEKKFIDEIIPYLGKYSLEKNTKNRKRPPAKYYALYHRILIEIKEKAPFELVNDTELPKKLIEEYGEVNYGFTDGQSFYREFAKINTLTPLEITRSFGKGYKQKVIEISQNCAKVIKHLEKYPN